MRTIYESGGEATMYSKPTYTFHQLHVLDLFEHINFEEKEKKQTNSTSSK